MATELLEELGTTATLTVVTAATYANDGSQTETTSAYTIVCSDLVDESNRYTMGDTGRKATGTFYAAAEDLEVTPKVGNRITYRSRYFEVLAVSAYAVTGGTAAYRLDVAELGAP